MSQEYPTLNEFEQSWADIAVLLQLRGATDIKTSDIAAVKWSDKVDVGVTRGTTGGRKKKSTAGQYDCDGTITFYVSGWELFLDALAQQDARISLVFFDVLIQHTPVGKSGIHSAKLIGARVLGRTADMKEGADPDKIEVPLYITRIEENGISLL